MNFFNRFIKILQFILPSPFSIAIILTFITVLLALIFTSSITNEFSHFVQVVSFWEKGFWELLTFAMQMMLMLVLGHVLALTKLVSSIIKQLTRFCTSTAKSALLISLFTIIVSLINWGLGLIFGAVLARKVGEQASASGKKINYPLIGAAGYSGLMVWHGGLSGSAPLKVAESSHFLVDKIGVIPVSETIFSNMNVNITFAIILIIPAIFYLIGFKTTEAKIDLKGTFKLPEAEKHDFEGAEKLDTSAWFIKLFAIFIIGTGILRDYYQIT